MLSPHGRMSPFQQAQMFSLQDANIHNIAIEGVFDDCQDIVKAVSADLDFKRAHSIGTVNSINWARLLAQVVYYFAGYFQATKRDDEAVDFAVPSGNFGNICAGHVARMMGLPIRRLVLATNENDVLDEFFRTGVYRVRSAAETHETSSPSMDISKASNFERFVFDLLGRDAARTRALFAEVETRRVFALDAARARADRRVRLRLRAQHARRPPGDDPRHVHERFGEVIDTHTADGLKVAREHAEPGDADDRARDRAAGEVRRHHPRGARPRRAAAGRASPASRRCRSASTSMPADVAAVKAFIAENDRR